MISSSTLRDAALLMLRIVVAATFINGGYGKLFLWSADPSAMGMSMPMWYLMLFLSIAEPIGAVAIAAGVLTRTAAACNAIIMIGALVIMKYNYGTAYFTLPQAPGLDFNMHLLAESVILAAFGAGSFAVDRLWTKKSAQA